MSLSKRFEAKISSLEDSIDMSEIIILELINALQAQEKRRAMRRVETEQIVEGAYLPKTTKGKGKIPKCSHCKKLGHEEKDCCHKEKPQCFKCKRFGHLQKNCRVKKEEQPNIAKVAKEETFFWTISSLERCAPIIEGDEKVHQQDDKKCIMWWREMLHKFEKCEEMCFMNFEVFCNFWIKKSVRD